MFVTLGEALFDLIPANGQSLSNIDLLELRPGGAPLNVSVALHRLGVASHYCGTLSTDPLGRRLASLIADEGIQHSPKRPVDHPTRLGLVDHGPGGTSFRFYGDDPADAQLTEVHVDTVLDGAVSGIYVGSLMMSNPMGNRVQRYAVQRALTLGIPIFADPNPRPPAWDDPQAMRDACIWLMERASVVKLSLHDAGLLDLGESAEAVVDRSDFAADIVVTDGERGCWARIADRIVRIPPIEVDTVDPTGAGDAFFAGVIAHYLDDRQLTEARLRFASAAGALVSTWVGAIDGLPTLEVVNRFIDERNV